MQGTMGGEMVEAGGNLASRERKEESFSEGPAYRKFNIGVFKKALPFLARARRATPPLKRD